MRARPAVLVVDDDSDTQEMLRTALEAEGYAVSTASSARAALDHLRSSHGTCCVLLDLNLGGADGAQFRAAQQRDRALAWIPVIVVSGQPDGAEIARRFEAQAFLRKPFDLDELLRIVARMVTETSASRRRQGFG